MLDELRGPRPERGGRAALAAAILLGVVIAAAPNPVYRDGPPPGFAGGFGESSCGACHFSGEENSGPGALRVEGVPEVYTPGEEYPLIVTLARQGMALSGFGLTTRFSEDGSQAGDLTVGPGEAARAAVVADREILYAYQLDAGSELATADTARWTIVWTAPWQGGPIQLHLAANAADGDGTAEGDEVYTAVVNIEPAP